MRSAEKTDEAVLAALGHEPLYMRDIRKNMKERKNISEPTIFRSLARLVAASTVERIEKQRTHKKNGRQPTGTYKGHGPEPTVFWRRV